MILCVLPLLLHLFLKADVARLLSSLAVAPLIPACFRSHNHLPLKPIIPSSPLHISIPPLSIPPILQL